MPKGCTARFLDGGVHLRRGVAGQVKFFDLGNALHYSRTFVTSRSSALNLRWAASLRALHGGIDYKEQQQPRRGDEPHAPVKDEHHNGDDAGGESLASLP